MRNKKDVHIKQLKGDLAKLLEAGQEQTARIRVEHFFREEKSKEAYELIEIFCELIVARMPMIESQKNCPIDLKEAVSSVIFASPRCADIPELMDIRKHFKSKYGKEFVSAAVELRPECGVNRMIVEKLSAKAPDGQSKIKILTAIAEEHNIKWDPKSFGDNINPPADLLNGPNTFGKGSHIQMESIGGQSSFDHNNKESPRIHVPFKADERPCIPEKSPEESLRSKYHSQQSNFAHVNANQSNTTLHHNPETSSERTHRYSNSGDQNNYSSGRRQWSMDFKDATSAAKAAAESAELASLAARAAAELSSRGNISQPSSSEFQTSSSYNLRAEGPQGYASVHLQDQQLPKDQVSSATRKSSITDDNWRDIDTKRYMGDDSKNISYPSSSVSNNDVNTSATNFNAADRYSFKNSSEPRFSDSLGSSATVEKQPRKHDADTFVTSFNAADRYSFKNSSEPGFSGSLDSVDEQPRNFDSNAPVTNFNESDRYSLKNPSEPGFSGSLGSTRMEKQPRNVDVEYVSDQQFGTGFDRTSSYGDVRIENDAIKVPSHEKLGNDTYENPFAMDKPNDIESTADTSFNDHASVLFDDYGPDDDYVPDYDFQRREPIPELSSPEGKVLINSSTDDTWIFNQNKNDSPEKAVSHSQNSDRTSLFAGNIGSSDDPSHSDDLLPVTFDHSDGPSSESEEELKESEIIGKEDSSEFFKKQDLYSEKSEWTRNISHGLSGSSDEENSSMPSRRLSSEVNPVHESKEKDSLPSSLDIVEESTSEGYSGLNFEKLKGGRRNQKSNKLPYANNSSRSDLPFKQACENDASIIEQSTSISSSTARTSYRSNASTEETYDRSVEERSGEEKGSRAKLNSFNSNLDDFKEKISDYTLGSDQESHSNKVVDEILKKPAPTRVAVKYAGFCNDDDSEEDSPGQNMKNSPRRVIGLSRRTKASPKRPSPHLEDSSRTPMSHEDITERKASTSFYAPTLPLKAKTGTSYSDRYEISDQPQSSKPLKQTHETKRSYNEERLKSTSAEEQQYNYPPELDRRGNFESSKFPSSSRETTAASVKTWAESSNSEQPQSTKPSKPIPETKRSFHEERLKSPTKELPSNPSPKLETQGNSESSRKENTKAVEKASHVHPKLPDYDNFAAHFLSLRKNHK